MATHFTQDAVLHFLRSRGGSVKNAELLQHFHDYLREHPDRDRNRDLFKKFVNSVATVRQIDGASYVILRSRFRGGQADPPAPLQREEPGLSPAATSGSPRPRTGQDQREAAPTAPRGPGGGALPAAGILPPNSRPQISIAPSLPGGPRPALAIQERGALVVPERRASTSLERGGLAAPDRGASPGPVRAALVVPERRVSTSLERGGSAAPDRGASAGPVRGGPSPLERGVPAGPERRVPASPERGGLGALDGGASPVPVRGALVIPEMGGPGVSERGAPGAPERGGPAGPVRGALVVPERGGPASPDRGGLGAPDRGASAGPVRGALVVPEKGGLAVSPRGALDRGGPVKGGASASERGIPMDLERRAPVSPEGGGLASPRGGQSVTERGVPAFSERVPPVGPERGASASPERGGPSGSSPVQNSSPGLQRPPLGVPTGSTSGGFHKKPNLQTPIQEPNKGSRGQLQQQRGPQQESSPPLQTLQPVLGVRRNYKHRKSYKSAVSQDDDEEEDYEEEIQTRGGSKGGVWPLSGEGRAASTTPPCIVDTVAPSSVTSSGKVPLQIYIHSTEGQTPTPWGPLGVWQPEQPAGSQLEVGSCESTSTRHSVPLKAMHHSPPAQRGERIPQHTAPAGGSPQPGLDQRHSPPAQRTDGIPLHIAPAGGSPQPGPDQRHRLSPRYSSNASLSSDAQVSCSDNSLQSSSRRSQCSSSSSEDLLARTDSPGMAPEVQDGFQHSQRSLLTPGSYTSRRKGPPAWRSSAGNLCDDHQSLDNLSVHHGSTDSPHKDDRFPNQHMPWFFSTGDLCDNPEEAYSSEGSSCSPQLRQRPAAVRRVDSALRSRMCLSLGADLDQLLDVDPTGNEAARLMRLQRISSSLSLHRNLSSTSLSSCPTPPRSGSPAPMVDNEGQKGGRGKSSTATNASTGHTNGQQPSSIPLEPREHSWMVKAASGSWGDIYSLLREDPSLLNKRDFISGFTVLHWIAKHGDHRVLNTLWYGASKLGLSFDINAKSTAGQTPLHIAAIHNSKNIISLLVKSFCADVRLRDTAGKRPWQYLENPSQELLTVLGAQQWAAEQKPLKKQRDEASQPQKQRHHVRHNFSFASPKQRPLTYIGMAKVKRSTSIAAFLKSRSQPFDWHKSESSA